MQLMFRRLLAPLGTAILWMSVAAAADLTDQQKRLLEALPGIDRVVAAAPVIHDPVENTVSREIALGHFQALADSIAKLNPAAQEALLAAGANRYYSAIREERLATMKRIGAWGNERKFAATEQKMLTIARAMNADPQKFYLFRAHLFQTLLDGELREYAMDWHYRNGGDSVPLPPKVQMAVWAGKLPPPIRELAEAALALPGIVWVGLLLAWVAYGVTRRGGPFRLDPNDPLTLMVGKKRRHMAFHDGIITDNNVRETERVHVSYKVNEYGQRQGPDDVRTYHSLTQNLNLHELSGRNIPITLRNHEFQVHDGQRVLVVYDKKSTKFLFLHNRDNGVTRYMPLLMSYYRLRPLIFIPLWALTAVVAEEFAPQWFTIVLLVFPVVYFFITWRLNRRRWKKLESELIPGIIEATKGM
jgi:hypothetical protein